MKEIIHNPDNLTKADIDEVVIRVKALIINSKNEITLGYCFKTYQFPGGHLETGEELDDGLIREVREETGIELKKPIPEPFQKTTYYTKNYRGTNKNRENDIYYYIIRTDEVFNMDNTSLDPGETDGNYQCVLIPMDKVDEVLINSIPDNPINEVIAGEMLQVLKEYREAKIY